MKKFLGNALIAVVFALGIAMVAYPASVTQIAGLAVAQSSTQWNQIRDMAQGDGFANGVGAFSPCLFNGVTCDRQRGTIAGGADVAIKSVTGGVTPADAFANPTNALTVGGFTSLFNGTTWDRGRTASADALAITGMFGAGQMNWNGTSFDRARTASADNLAATGIPAAGNMGFDSSTWDRLTSISNTNNTGVTSQGVRYSTQLSTWSRTNTPAVATQATANIAAGGGTVRHVATSVTVCIAANATAQTPLLFHLRDGATGAGTILRTWAFSAPVTTSQCENVSGLNMTGSANTAMTIESAAAGVAGSQATVSMTGYSTP